jgi:hypothetical protein
VIGVAGKAGRCTAALLRLSAQPLWHPAGGVLLAMAVSATLLAGRGGVSNGLSDAL